MILLSSPHTPCTRVFVGQDLLEPDWDVQPAPAAVDATATVSSCALRGSSVSRREPEKNCPEQAGWSSGSLCNGTVSLHSSALAVRQLPSTRPAPQNNSLPNVAALQSRGGDTAELLKLKGDEEDFDDWDVDLADLDESLIWQPLQSPAPPAPVANPTASAKKLRPPSHGGLHVQPNQSVRELSPARQASASSAIQLPPQTLSTPLHSPYSHAVVHSAPLLRPNICPAPSPISRPGNRPQQQHRPCTTPRPFPHPHGLFDNSSPAPSRSSSILSPHPLHTPVLTNRLVQLVSASSKLPSKRPRSGWHQPRTRRFPGPAGLLPEQVGLPQPECSCICFSEGAV